MTFGNIPAHEHHARFEELALSEFSKQADNLRAEKQPRFISSITAHEHYAYTPSEGDDIDKKHYIHLSWVLGDSSSLQDVLEAQLISGVLLENSASPLQRYLETTSLGNSPSALCGMDNSGREITFTCGLEGTTEDNADAFENEVLALFEEIKHNNVEQSLVEAVLHQIELSQREITGNSYPYGLSLMLASLPAALHDGNPIDLLDIDTALASLRTNIQNPDYIPSLMAKLFIDNPHRLRLLMSPDLTLQQSKDAAEKKQLQTLKAQLSSAEKQAIIEATAALEERQSQEDDPNILPKLLLSDIPKTISFPKQQTVKSDYHLSFYPQATNGLVYQDMRLPLNDLSTQEWSLLPILTASLTELGAQDKSYLDMQQQQSAHTGGIHAFSQIRYRYNDSAIKAYWGLSGKALSHKHAHLNALQFDFLTTPRLDEHTRIRELVQQMRAGQERSITGNGHALAMQAASSSLNALAGLQHLMGGLHAIKQLKQLDDSLNKESALKRFSQDLSALHSKLLSTHSPEILLIAESQNLDQCVANYNHEQQAVTHQPLTLDLTINTSKKQLWLTQTQVNFCAKAFPSVRYTHADSPALTVLGSFLRNGFLHRTIREQGGAYGGGASQDSRLGVFKFYSYRDPRLVETLNDFDASIEWLLNTDHEAHHLEEAIMTVVASIDKPSSPAGEARQEYTSQLFELTHAQQENFRNSVLATSIEDLQRVARTYLSASENAGVAVISSASIINKLEETHNDYFKQHGFESFEL